MRLKDLPDRAMFKYAEADNIHIKLKRFHYVYDGNIKETFIFSNYVWSDDEVVLISTIFVEDL